MQQVYWLADTHFGHGNNITQFRPQFSTPEEHNATILDNINTVVNPTDTLILPGDAVIRPEGLVFLEAIRCRRVILVPGNHCGERMPIPHHAYHKVMGAYEAKINNKVGVTTHIPIHPSCLDRWQFNIHGHLHEETLIDYRYINVSCEQTDYKPVNKEWIGGRMEDNYLRSKRGVK